MDQWEWALGFAVVSALALTGFVAGVARPWLARIATLFVAGVAVGYAALLVVTAAYAATCSGCASHISYDSSRPADLTAAMLWGGLFTAGIALCAWVGAESATLFRRLVR